MEFNLGKLVQLPAIRELTFLMLKIDPRSPPLRTKRETLRSKPDKPYLSCYLRDTAFSLHANCHLAVAVACKRLQVMFNVF